MSKSLIVFFSLAMLIGFSAGRSALGDENPSSGQSPEQGKAKPGSVANQAANTVPGSTPVNSPATGARSAPSSSAPWPKRVAGVIAGVIVGIPVSAVRQPIHEEKYGISQTAGDKARPRKSIPWAVIYSPFALVSGLIEAPFYALDNSLVNADRPFSKEQFSIKTREEPLNVDPIKGTSER